MRLRAIEQPPDLVVDEALVVDPPERREGLGTAAGAARRHHRPLVPAEHAQYALEVLDLGEALPELRERPVHGRERTR